MKIKHTYKLTCKRIKNAFQLIQKGYFRIFFKELKHRIYSKNLAFGLKRDLNEEFKTPSAKIDIKIRPLKPEDLPALLENTPENPVNPRIIANQQALVDANIPSCYVAVTEDEKPAYMQWLIGYKHRKLISKFFKGLFPELNKSEALLEGAYSNPSFRGLRIMPEAMSKIAEKAVAIDARWVITFVDINNIPSLKGCKRSGFEPYILRECEWFLFRYTVSFHPLPSDLLEVYHQQMGIRPKKVSDEKIETVNQKSQSLEQAL